MGPGLYLVPAGPPVRHRRTRGTVAGVDERVLPAGSLHVRPRVSLGVSAVAAGMKPYEYANGTFRGRGGRLARGCRAGRAGHARRTVHHGDPPGAGVAA